MQYTPCAHNKVLHRDTPAFTPGPGSYKAASSFSRRPVKRSWQTQGQPKPKSALPKGPHLPPSVPSKAQSYGYVCITNRKEKNRMNAFC